MIVFTNYIECTLFVSYKMWPSFVESNCYWLLRFTHTTLTHKSELLYDYTFTPSPDCFSLPPMNPCTVPTPVEDTDGDDRWIFIVSIHEVVDSRRVAIRDQYLLARSLIRFCTVRTHVSRRPPSSIPNTISVF